MTPAARVQTAIELLDTILAGTPAEQAITGWARRSRFAGSKDRAAIRDLVFQAMRCLRSYACLGGAMTGRGVMVGAIRSAGTPHEDIFSGLQYAPSTLSETEQAAGHEPSDLGDRLDLSDWIIPQFINDLGGEAHAISTAEMMQERAPVMLRVNTRKTSVEGAIVALADDGVTALQAAIAKTALHVTEGARKVALSAAYQTGLVELQDGSSQAAMAEIHIPTGARVLDFCAGGGGKVLALAAAHEADWFAHDALPHRMVDLPKRATRAGASITVIDPYDELPAPFDLVLCDVPCSGSGTWRRTPDAKWRLTQDDLDDLVRTQAGILDRAAELVSDGGTLAYATCSLLTVENEDVIDGFVTRFPEWEVTFTRRWLVSSEGDGFFLAQLKKIAGDTTQP